MIQLLISFVFVVICFILIVLILMQKGRGGGLTGAFGAGGGSDTFLGTIQNKEIVRWTTYLAIAFLLLAVVRDFAPPTRSAGDVGDLTVGTTTTAPAPTTAESVPPADGGTAPVVPVVPDEAMPAAEQPAAPAPATGQ